MRHLVVSLILTMACAMPAAAQEREVQLFAWLTGTWEMSQGARHVEEVWSTPTANAMIGTSRTIADNRTTEFEFLRLEKRGADLFYVPQPGGRPPVAFKLTSADGGRFIFENTTGEDRVSRIEYRREGDDGLLARVEGAQDGKPFTLEYRYRRRK